MTFIPSGGGSSSVIAGVQPKQPLVQKSLGAAGVCFAGSQVDLLSNGKVQNTGGVDNNTFIHSITSSNSSNVTTGVYGNPQVVHMYDNFYFIFGGNTSSTIGVAAALIEVDSQDFSSFSVVDSLSSAGATAKTVHRITRMSDTICVCTCNNASGQEDTLYVYEIDRANNTFSLIYSEDSGFSGASCMSCARISASEFVITQGISASSSGQKVTGYTIASSTVTKRNSVDLYTTTEYHTYSATKINVACMNDLGDFVVQGWYDGTETNVLYVGRFLNGVVSISSNRYNLTAAGFGTFNNTVTHVLLSPSENVGVCFENTTTDSYLVFSFNDVTKAITLNTRQVSTIAADWNLSADISQRSIGLLPFDGAIFSTTNAISTIYKVVGEFITVELQNASLSSLSIIGTCTAYNSDFNQIYIQGRGASDNDSNNDILILDADTMTTSISNAAEALFVSSVSKVSSISSSAGIILDSSNFRLISISDAMSGEAIDTSTAHSLSASAFEISKVSATQSIGAFIVSGVVNLKAAENPTGTTLNVGTADTFATGVTAIDVSSQIVVYSNASQVAVRAFTVAGTAITSGAELQLQASVSSSVSVSQLAVDKVLVTTDNAAYLVTISGVTATLADTLAIDGSDTIDQASVSALSATEALLFYRSSSKSNTLWSRLITESASSLSMGAARQVAPDGSVLSGSMMSSSTKAMLVFTDGSDSRNKFSIVNNSLIVENKVVIYNANNVTDDIDYISDGRILLSNNRYLFSVAADDSSFEVVREKIGIAKSNAYSGSDLSVEVYGVSELTAFSGLTIGDSILASDDSESGYAISETVIIQLPS